MPCQDSDGFSLHAAIWIEAHDRNRLAQLCRYITWPALSDERLKLNAARQLRLKLRTPWRDRTARLVMNPLEFRQLLAGLVPRLRQHVIRLHEMLTPNATVRPLVVPTVPPAQAQAQAATEAAGRIWTMRPHRPQESRQAMAAHSRSLQEAT